MNKLWIAAVSALALLNGCASVPQGSIPVVDSGVAVSNNERVSAQRTAGNYPQAAAPRAAPPAAGWWHLCIKVTGFDVFGAFMAANNSNTVAASRPAGR